MAGQDDEVPGFVSDPKLEAKLDGLDEHLNPIKDEELHEDDKPKGTEKSSEAEKDEGSEEAGKSEKAGESTSADDEKSEEEDGAGKTDKGDESDEGYTIDEGEDEQEEVGKEEPRKTEGDDASSKLTPEAKYIIDNLEPITVRGTIGSETEIKEYKVYSPEYLPQGFKFVDDREMSAANKGFASLEQRALQLQSDFRGQETQKAAAEFKQREDAADRQDIATLQKAGELPRFKVKPDSANFEKDPGVVLVQEVLDFKEEMNAKYMEQYNAGRPYKHIGFEEAWRMFQRNNPTKSNPDQQREDKDRSDIAKRTSKSNGSSTKEEHPKAGVHSGMTSMDLDNLIESKTSAW